MNPYWYLIFFSSHLVALFIGVWLGASIVAKED